MAARSRAPSSAADLKFLRCMPRVLPGTSNRQAALEVKDFFWCLLSEARIRGRCNGLRTSERGHQVKAVWYERTGPAPEVLTFGDMPTPMAGAGEVRVRLEASGINPADVGRRGGGYRPMEYPRVIPN